MDLPNLTALLEASANFPLHRGSPKRTGDITLRGERGEAIATVYGSCYERQQLVTEVTSNLLVLAANNFDAVAHGLVTALDLLDDLTTEGKLFVDEMYELLAKIEREAGER